MFVHRNNFSSFKNQIESLAMVINFHKLHQRGPHPPKYVKDCQLTSFLADVASKVTNWPSSESTSDAPKNSVGTSGSEISTLLRDFPDCSGSSRPIQVENSPRRVPLPKLIGVTCYKNRSITKGCPIASKKSRLISIC